MYSQILLILTELVKQTELAKVTLRRETPLIQVIDRPILPLPQRKIWQSQRIGDGWIFGRILNGVGIDW